MTMRRGGGKVGVVLIFEHAKCKEQKQISRGQLITILIQSIRLHLTETI